MPEENPAFGIGCQGEEIVQNQAAGCHAGRVIADGVASFDTIPDGYNGSLYAEICPGMYQRQRFTIHLLADRKIPARQQSDRGGNDRN